MCRHNEENDSSLNRLLDRYGELLSLDDLVTVLKYKTTGAIRKAHARGVLPVPLYRFKNKTGFYAKTDDVAECLDMMEVSKPV